MTKLKPQHKFSLVWGETKLKDPSKYGPEKELLTTLLNKCFYLSQNVIQLHPFIFSFGFGSSGDRLFGFSPLNFVYVRTREESCSVARLKEKASFLIYIYLHQLQFRDRRISAEFLWRVNFPSLLRVCHDEVDDDKQRSQRKVCTSIAWKQSEWIPTLQRYLEVYILFQWRREKILENWWKGTDLGHALGKWLAVSLYEQGVDLKSLLRQSVLEAHLKESHIVVTFRHLPLFI